MSVKRGSTVCHGNDGIRLSTKYNLYCSKFFFGHENMVNRNFTCARIIFQRDNRALGGHSLHSMADRVALLVQASQNQQNNSVKHSETLY